jgi:hypothetical protein
MLGRASANSIYVRRTRLHAACGSLHESHTLLLRGVAASARLCGGCVCLSRPDGPYSVCTERLLHTGWGLYSANKDGVERVTCWVLGLRI